MVQENNVDIVVVEVNATLTSSMSTSTLLKATNPGDVGVDQNVADTLSSPMIPESVSILKDGGVLFSIENGNVNNNWGWIFPPKSLIWIIASKKHLIWIFAPKMFGLTTKKTLKEVTSPFLCSQRNNWGRLFWPIEARADPPDRKQNQWLLRKDKMKDKSRQRRNNWIAFCIFGAV